VRDGDDLPLEGRLVAFDLGTVRLGVAVSDPAQVVASPDATLALAPGESDDVAALAARLADEARSRDAVGIVVGDPRALDGTVGDASRHARRVAEALRSASGLPVRLWDERLTTTEAERVLVAADVSRAGRRRVIDRVAAGVLLRTVLDAQARRREVGR
jgi:putative holliday junction resolvase